MKKLLGTLSLAGLLAATGCTYGMDRGRDLLDMFYIDAGGGAGLHVDVLATDLLHLGAGWGQTRRAGIRGRDVGVWWELDQGAILWHEMRLGRYAHGFDGLPNDDFTIQSYEHKCFVSAVPGRIHAKPGTPERVSPIYWADIMVNVVAGVAGARAGISPGQVVDFLFGIFTIDIAEDDRLTEKRVERAKARKARAEGNGTE